MACTDTNSEDRLTEHLRDELGWETESAGIDCDVTIRRFAFGVAMIEQPAERRLAPDLRHPHRLLGRREAQGILHRMSPRVTHIALRIVRNSMTDWVSKE